MKKALAVLLAAVMCCTLLSACGQPETTDPTEGTEGTQTETNAADLVYAVEAGSAGEAIAKEKGWQTNPVTAQADTLMEVSAGTSDAAIIDLLMAAAMTGEGTSYPDLTYDSQGLTTEEYGIGCRKGSDLAQYINNVLAEAYADGTMKEIATTYKLQDALVEQPAAEEFTPAADGDVAYIQDKGTLIVGITEFEPMDYKDENGQWIGFDADMAKVVAEKLGVEVQFVVIDWDNKIMELDSKGVDAVWNGMTLTDEVKTSMNCSDPYATNAQVVVVPSDKADAAKDIESIKDMTFAVESGSAGEAAAQAAGLNATAVQSQADALMEVAAGTSDACVIDLLMAGAMIGDGTSYPNLTYTVNLNEANGEEDENYVVGFRKGSDLTEAFNDFYKAAYKDGVILSFAQKYGVQEAIVDPEA